MGQMTVYLFLLVKSINIVEFPSWNGVGDFFTGYDSISLIKVTFLDSFFHWLTLPPLFLSQGLFSLYNSIPSPSHPPRHSCQLQSEHSSSAFFEASLMYIDLQYLKCFLHFLNFVFISQLYVLYVLCKKNCDESHLHFLCKTDTCFCIHAREFVF